MKKIIMTIALAGVLADADAQKNKTQIVEISTSYGNMYVYLYDETPKHKANFLKLAGEGFYDSTTFHRVISAFMIQGGDPNTKTADKAHLAGQGGPGYTIDAEIQPGLYHRKGVLAAARMGDAVNPAKASSGSQFYIVQGKKLNDQELMMAEKQRQARNPSYKMPEEMKEAYRTIGGTPWLDGEYTIFGEVIKGLDVVDKIATVKTRPGDKPEEDIRITAKVIRVSKKELEKEYGYKPAAAADDKGGKKDKEKKK
ncbi:MAG: peptidylprolyl isomerase [Bacteroidia bacterium]|nr:peptidylprolyl isomerase [Bacteroidia bacterium]